jgi:chemotaxis protein methyltransferase CheR
VSGVVDRRDAERFRAAVSHRLGLQFDDTKLAFLGEVLQRRADRLGGSAAAYLRGLEAGPGRTEFAALAQELTVGETYFFRNSEQFHALRELVLPERMATKPEIKTLRILSAGCASGEEAYSIAIIARETITDPSWAISIRAVDLNPAVLEKASRARFSSWALRETPPEARSKWFRPDGREWILAETVRDAVRFEARNLASDDDELWQPQTFDVVFCRNVLIYFAPEPARALIARITRALQPGGYLFLGHADTLRGLSDNFHLRHTHGTFYYQLKEGVDHLIAPPPPAHPGWISTGGAGIALPSFRDAWVDAIREASERIAALVPATKATKPPEAAPPQWDLARALDLLRTERFGEALALLRELPLEAARDPDVLLLEAMLLAQSHQPAAAEATCQRLLAIDELNAGAHYVLALCRESAGDGDGAAEHDRVAVYLDPAFAMPRLHLGLLARRMGARDVARRELAQGLVLLQREDASRLLLFAGGFNRDALMALCGSALRDCGGQP